MEAGAVAAGGKQPERSFLVGGDQEWALAVVALIPKVELVDAASPASGVVGTHLKRREASQNCYRGLRIFSLP